MTWCLHRSAQGMVNLVLPSLFLSFCVCFPHVVFSSRTVFCLNTAFFFFSDAALEFFATIRSVTWLSFTPFPELFYVCKQPNISLLLIRSSLRFTSPLSPDPRVSQVESS